MSSKNNHIYITDFITDYLVCISLMFNDYKIHVQTHKQIITSA